MKVLDHLLKAVRDAAVFNPEVQVAPACILWPDRDRQWEAAIPLLQIEMPELMILGDYAPENRTGPAIWIRCAMAELVEDVSIPDERIPIIYLPGISRQDLRAVESCPDHLKPLAELQYRGVIWSQINAKDWTILAYLKSDQGGLGFDVAQDNEAKNAMQLALNRLLEEDVALMRGKRLDADYLNTLMTGGDPVRDLLQWLDDEKAFKAQRDDNGWKAFVAVSKSLFAFDPHKEGVLAGCAKLAEHTGPWNVVWERYCEAPQRYPKIPDHIRNCRPPSDNMFWSQADGNFQGWPQWNEAQEKTLHHELMGLCKMTAPEGRARIMELEKRHGHRRALVWAELGEAPLASALEHLAVVAQYSQTGLAAGAIDDLVSGYREYGWRVDDAVLRALAQVDSPADREAVTTAVRSVYLPWLEDSARCLQKLIDGNEYPGGTHINAKSIEYGPGHCVLFVDGLRFDTAKRLEKLLVACGHKVAEELFWTALPSLTATGKPAVAPVRGQITGHDDNTDFEPIVAATGQSLKGGYHLHKLLVDAGWTVLKQSEDGDGLGTAWCEFGNIDHEGHDRGWKLAKHVDTLLREIRERVTGLLAAGWKCVRIVTDHGWLLMPGGLPKTDLSTALVVNKWGRCASIKPGASTEARLFPWYWNPNQCFAMADGVSCYKKGHEYAHGGVSLQECLTLQLMVTQGESAQAAVFVFTDVVWKGLRCTVAVDMPGDISDSADAKFSGFSLDVRRQAGDPKSSLVLSLKKLRDNGTASVIVVDEEMEGQEAFVVLIDSKGSLVAQIATTIGGEKS